MPPDSGTIRNSPRPPGSSAGHLLVGEVLETESYVNDHILRGILEHAPVAILWVDAEGVVRFANAEVCQVLGVASPEECVGEKVSTFEPHGRIVARLAADAIALGTAELQAREAATPGEADRSWSLKASRAPIAFDGRSGTVVVGSRTPLAADDTHELHVRRLYDDAEPMLHLAALTSGSEHAFLDAATSLLGETARADQVFVLLTNEDADAYEEEVRWAREAERSLIPLRIDASESLQRVAAERGVIHLAARGPDPANPGLEYRLLASVGASEALAIPFQLAGDRSGILLLTHAEESAPWSQLERNAVERLAALFETLLAWIRAEDRYHQVVASIDDCLAAYSFGPAGQRSFSLMTAQVERMTGQSARAMMRGDVSWTDQVVHPEDRDAVDVFEKRLRGGEEARLTYRVMTCDGGSRWLQERAVPRRDVGGRVMVASILSDVTDQKEVEAALTEAKQAAEAANRMKSAFLATMSHELRTPLGVIKGFADVLEEEVRALEAPDNDIVEFATVIRANAARVLELVGDLLELARLQTDGVPIERAPVALIPMVRAVVDRHRTDLEARGIDVRVDESPANVIVSADSKRVEQVLEIILANAAKFTEAGCVSVELLVQPDVAQVTVRDTGIGIGEEVIDRVFEPFFQEDNSLNRSYEGSGLGLALAQRLVEAMGGTIGLSSRRGSGTAVSFTIPRADR